MKKIIAVILTAVMLMSMVSCEDKGSNKENKQTCKVSAGSLVQETDFNSNRQSSDFDPHSTIEETVLLDDDKIKITVTGMEGNFNGLVLNLSVENKTDKRLDLNCDKSYGTINSVNGYCLEPYILGGMLEAGETKTAQMTFDTYSLIESGIKEVAEIELQIAMKYEDDENRTYTPSVKIKTSIADSFDYTADNYQASIKNGDLSDRYCLTVDNFSDKELFNKNGIRIISQTFITTEYGNKDLLLQAENNTDKPVYLSLGNKYANGLLVDYGESDYWIVGPGKRIIIDDRVTGNLPRSVYDNFGMSSIGSVSFNLVMRSERNSDDAVTENLSILLNDENNKFNKTGDELYNLNDLHMVYKCMMREKDTNTVHLYLLAENKTDQRIKIDKGTNITVNGQEKEPTIEDTYL